MLGNSSMRSVLVRRIFRLAVMVVFLVFLEADAQQIVQGRAKLPEKFNPKKGVPQQIQDEAMRNAYREAVTREIEQLLTKETVEKNRPEIESKILAAAAGYRQSEEVVSIGPEDNDYVVTLRVTVDKDQLKRDLEGIGISTGVSSRKTVMLLIDEYFARDFKPPTEPQIAKELDISDRKDISDLSTKSGAVSYKEKTSASADTQSFKASEKFSAAGKQRISESGSVDAQSAAAAYEHSEAAKSSYSKYSEHVDKSEFALRLREYFPPEMNKQKMPESACAAEIAKVMLTRDIHLCDRQYVEQLRAQTFGDSGFLAGSLGDESKVAQAALLANQNFGADVLVIGAVNIIYNGKDSNGMENTVANLAVKVMDASTGTIMASSVSSQGGIATDAQNSAVVSARRLGSMVGPDIADQVVAFWKERSEKGEDYLLRVTGIKQTSLKLRFMDMFKNMAHVTSFDERIFDRSNGLLEVMVSYQGSPQEFKEAILRTAYDIPEFQTLEEQVSQGNTVNLILEQR